MKNFFLFALTLLMSTALAQQNKNGFKAMSKHAPDEMQITGHDFSSGSSVENPLKPEAQRSPNAVSVIPIGEAGNAFGFAFMRTTYLWADNNINSVSFIHRMLNPPGTGYLAMDISKDGGENWESNIQVYDPTLSGAANGRYPQAALYNPEGNTDPDNAFFHYFAPTLDGSNTGSGTDWGGYGYGVKQLMTGMAPTQHDQTSEPPDRYQYLPSGFTITQTGEAWMLDQNNLGETGGYIYQDELIIGHGIWNEDNNDFNYTFDFIELEINPDDGINDAKIAFAPDGQTGWICVLTNLPDVLEYSSYHPIFLKTEDGGENWSDPVEVPLGGPDGLEAIQQFISDENLEAFFSPDPVPPRDEIEYYMGYYCDLSVDAWGNPHISGMVCLSDNESGSIWPNEGVMAMFHIWSDDQGETWEAFNLRDLKRFRADFSNGNSTISQFNRPQVATTMDGGIIFFSWLDTDVEGVEDNSSPDIWFREYLPTLGTHGEDPTNVTEFSAAMWVSNFGCMSHYVFSEETETDYTCTIPFVYEEMQDGDPLAPVQFHYIPDFIKSYTITDITPEHINPVTSVDQNYPNPFQGSTSIQINLLRSSDLVMEVHNIAGQMVKTIDLGKVSKGLHDIVLNADDLNTSIYFYTMDMGKDRIKKKMIIR